MQTYIRHFFFLVLFSVSAITHAFDVPAMTGPVVDQVGLLNPQTKAMLSENLQRTFNNQGPQIQVLIVKSLNGESLEGVAIEVFDKWKLGTEKGDNGILFLIAPNEKRLRIEVGRGLEGDIPDAYAKRIVSDIVTPFFKTGEFDMGVTQGVAAIMHYSKAGELQGEATVQSRGERKAGGNRLGGKIVGGIVFILWILLFMFNPGLALALLFAGRGGGGGGRGSGGGGWSGGGGSSAGGGSSGSW